MRSRTFGRDRFSVKRFGAVLLNVGVSPFKREKKNFYEFMRISFNCLSVRFHLKC